MHRPPLPASARNTAALLSGALLPVAFAPLSWWAVAIICCAVLNLALRNATPGQTFAACLLFGIGLYATGASWIYVSIHQYGQAPLLLATLLTALFVIGLGAVFALPLIFYAYTKHGNPCLRVFLFAAIWVIGEWFRGWFLTGFPWLYLGYGLVDTWLAGWAPIGGVLAISGIVAFSGAVLAEGSVKLYQRRYNSAIPEHRLPQNQGSSKNQNQDFSQNQPEMTGTILLILTLLILTALWLGGSLLQKQEWTQPAATSPLSVTLVQPNNPVLTKWDQNTLPTILSDIRKKTVALAHQDIIVWPEAAIPALQNSVQGFLDELDDIAVDQQTALVMGLPTSANNQYFNAVIGLGAATGSYQKRRLVPFGEYVPLEQWLRGAIAFFDLPMSSFSAGGDQQALIQIGPYRLATAICYEIAYSGPLATDARLANLLLTVSNDTWFGDSLGPHQHLQIARIRALETGKALMRATNDGITAFIDAKGRVQSQLPRFSPGVLQGTVMPRQGTTPYTRWGVLPVISLCLVLLVTALMLSLRRRNKKT